MNKIGQGNTADIFEYQNGGILKLFKIHTPLDDINQEFHISQLVNGLGINSPKPYEIIHVNNRNGIVFERITGVTLLAQIMKKPWLINQHSKRLANLQHKLHTHRVTGELRNQKEILRNNIMNTQLLTEMEKKRTIQFLNQLPTDEKLCHGDFHPDNVMVGQNEWVIDWLNGMSGNPAGDVARTIILINFGTIPDDMPIVLKLFIKLLRRRLTKEYINQYIRVSGLTYSDIDRWLLPVAAARLTEGIPSEEQGQILLIVKDRLKSI